MALLKDIRNEFGADFSYHKISRIDVYGNQIEITVSSYYDKTARESDSAHTSSTLRIYDADTNGILTDIYNLIKEKFPPFKGCEDDLEAGEEPVRNTRYEWFIGNGYGSIEEKKTEEEVNNEAEDSDAEPDTGPDNKDSELPG